MQWCELRAWLPTDLSEAGALPYLGICFRWEVVKIWLPQALCSRACPKRLFPAHASGEAGRVPIATIVLVHGEVVVALVKCVSLCGILQGLTLRLLKHMWLVLGHLPGKRGAGLVVFEGGAFLTAGRCFQASEAGKNQFTCENQPGGACWLLFGFLCLSRRRSECLRFPLERNCAFLSLISLSCIFCFS